MIEQLKAEITQALRDHDEIKKGILRTVLGEIQTLEVRNNKSVSDEQAVNIIRKLIQTNEEVLKIGPSEKLEKENVILKTLLPQTWSLDQIVTFLNTGDNVSKILQAKSDGQATGEAIKLLKSVSAPVINGEVVTVVKAMRENNG